MKRNNSLTFIGSLGSNLETAAQLNYGHNIIESSGLYLGSVILPQAIKNSIVYVSFKNYQYTYLGVYASGHGSDKINGWEKSTIFQFPNGDKNDITFSNTTQRLICICTENGFWTANMDKATLFNFPYQLFYGSSLPTDYIVNAISYDGSIGVGNSNNGVNQIPTYWYDIYNYATLPSDTYGYANGCNQNASIIVGSAYVTARSIECAVYWDADKILHELPSLDYFNMASAIGIAYVDSSIIVGKSSNTPVYWDVNRAIHTLPDLGFGGFATGCSGNAEIIFGEILDVAETHACYWTDFNTLHTLSSLTVGLDADDTHATASSLDGSIIVGHSASSGVFHAVFWDSSRDVFDLGLLPGGYSSFAYGCSSDGAIIVGTALDIDGIFQPVFWQRQTDNIYDINVMPRLNLATDSFAGEVYSVSGDGLTCGGVGDDFLNNTVGIIWKTISG
jgi:uncharacterized membrane protein